MSDDRTHDDISPLLSAAALDVLEQEELHQVLDHVNGCPDCSRQLAEYREVVARLTFGLPVRPMDASRAAGIRNRLLNRVRSQASDSAPSLQGRRARVLARVARWPGWAVAAGLVGLTLIHHSVHRPLDYGWLAAGVLAVSLAVLALYARKQAARHSALQERMTRLERMSSGERGDKAGRTDPD